MLDGEEFKISDEESFGNLPALSIYQIAVDKQAVKEYVPYGNQKSYYLPTGMQGPTIKLDCRVDDMEPWNEVYTNDYLKVVSFGFTTWEVILSIGSGWWVDNISSDVKSGFRRGDKLRHEFQLDLYKRTVA